MGSGIDSPMTNLPAAVPSKGSHTAGKFNEGSGLGPKGVDGGVPLKFIDDSAGAGKSTPIDTTMTIVPMKRA